MTERERERQRETVKKDRQVDTKRYGFEIELPKIMNTVPIRQIAPFIE